MPYVPRVAAVLEYNARECLIAGLPPPPLHANRVPTGRLLNYWHSAGRRAERSGGDDTDVPRSLLARPNPNRILIIVFVFIGG